MTAELYDRIFNHLYRATRRTVTRLPVEPPDPPPSGAWTVTDLLRIWPVEQQLVAAEAAIDTVADLVGTPMAPGQTCPLRETARLIHGARQPGRGQVQARTRSGPTAILELCELARRSWDIEAIEPDGHVLDRLLIETCQQVAGERFMACWASRIERRLGFADSMGADLS